MTKTMKKPGPYIATKRAKKTPGKTVKVGGTVVIKPHYVNVLKKGQQTARGGKKK